MKWSCTLQPFDANRKHDRFRLYAFKLFVCLFLCVYCSLQGSEPGTVIVLYGTPCSGKSTLAYALQEKLDGKYHIVKRTDIVRGKRQEIIENVTGKRLESGADIIQEMLRLPEKYREQAMAQNREGLMALIHSINARVVKGENFILDVCLDSQERTNCLEGCRVVKVLVYAPLRLLSERDLARAIQNGQGIVFHHKRRNAILSMYGRLYRPIKDPAESVLDTLAADDLAVYTKGFGEEVAYPAYCGTLQGVARKFFADGRTVSAIAPEQTPDLLVNTSVASPEEAATRVAAYVLISKNSAASSPAAPSEALR